MDDEDLRLAVYRAFAATGRAPGHGELAAQLGASVQEVAAGLGELARGRHLALGAQGGWNAATSGGNHPRPRRTCAASDCPGRSGAYDPEATCPSPRELPFPRSGLLRNHDDATSWWS